MLSTKHILVIGIGLGCIFLAYTDKNQIIKMTKVECFPNDDFVMNVSCRVRAFSRVKSTLNIKFFFKEPIKDLFMMAELFRKSDLMMYRPFLVNVSGVFCSGTTNEKNTFFFFLLHKFYRRFLVAEHQCPFKGELWIKDLYPNASRLPVPAIVGEYRLDFSFLELDTMKKIIKIRGYGFAKENEA